MVWQMEAKIVHCSTQVAADPHMGHVNSGETIPLKKPVTSTMNQILFHKNVKRNPLCFHFLPTLECLTNVTGDKTDTVILGGDGMGCILVGQKEKFYLHNQLKEVLNSQNFKLLYTSH